MAAGVAATAVAPGTAGVEHAPGWKHPLPAMVTVDEVVRSDPLLINARYLRRGKSGRRDPRFELRFDEKSTEGPPGMQEAMLGNFET